MYCLQNEISKSKLTIAHISLKCSISNARLACQIRQSKLRLYPFSKSSSLNLWQNVLVHYLQRSRAILYTITCLCRCIPTQPRQRWEGSLPTQFCQWNRTLTGWQWLLTEGQGTFGAHTIHFHWFPLGFGLPPIRWLSCSGRDWQLPTKIYVPKMKVDHIILLEYYILLHYTLKLAPRAKQRGKRRQGDTYSWFLWMSALLSVMDTYPYRKVFHSGTKPPVFVDAKNADVRHFRIVKEVRCPRPDRLRFALPRARASSVVPLDYWRSSSASCSVICIVLLEEHNLFSLQTT